MRMRGKDLNIGRRMILVMGGCIPVLFFVFAVIAVSFFRFCLCFCISSPNVWFVLMRLELLFV